MTSNHEGVSCDSCRKSNFTGLRYKCLTCHDYDLCAACFETGIGSSRHTPNHPMQCIVAKNDYDIFYAGETVSTEQPQSLTCPLCGSLGFTEATLLEHATSEHVNSDAEEISSGVVCPICGSQTNQITYDFATHLTMEHRAPRDPIDQATIRGRGARCHARPGGQRGRRSQPHHCGVGVAAGSSPSSREPTENLAEILAQISGVRRAGGNNQSQASHLQQLQMQIQSSPSFSPRAPNDARGEVRIMRRTFQSVNNQLGGVSTTTVAPSSQMALSSAGAIGGISSGSYAAAVANQSHYCSNQPFMLMDQTSLATAAMVSSTNAAAAVAATAAAAAAANNASGLGGATSGQSEKNNPSSQYLLARCMKPILSETEQQEREILRADRSLFAQELLLQIGLLEKS